MGYFQADERYLSNNDTAAIEAPWNVQIGEAGAVGQMRLTWRAPYTSVDSYGLYGRPADGTTDAWQELARIPAPSIEVRLTLAPGTWQLYLTARRGTADSPPSAELRRRVEAPLPAAACPLAPAVVPTPVGPAMPSAPASPPMVGVNNPPAPEFDWTALDQALHANQAHLGRHGLFVRRARRQGE